MNYLSIHKKIRFTNSVSSLLGIFVALVVQSVTAQSATLIEDTFSLTGGRIVGDSLEGTVPAPIGVGSTWFGGIDTSSTVFISDGAVGASTTAENRININAPSAVQTVSITYKVGDASGWVGFGFLFNEAGWFDNASPVWEYVTPTGQWVGFVRGVSETVFNTQIVNFSSSSEYTFCLSLDVSNNMARAYYINGDNQEVNAVTTNDGWFAVDLSDLTVNQVGFRLEGPGGGTSVSEFSLTAVPEPNTAMLLLGGLGMLGLGAKGYIRFCR